MLVEDRAAGAGHLSPDGYGSILGLWCDLTLPAGRVWKHFGARMRLNPARREGMEAFWD